MEWAQSLVAGFRQLSQGTLCALYALFGFLQILVPPFPGDILLFLGGGFKQAEPVSRAVPMLASYWAGTTLGSLGAFEVGRRFGARVLRAGPVQRLFPERAQTSVTRWLGSYGAVTIFAAKFVTGMNVPMLVLSGALGYDRRKCTFMIVLTTVVHNAIFFFLGRAAGKNLSVIAGWFGRYRLALVLAVAFLLGALLLGPRLLRRASREEEK